MPQKELRTELVQARISPGLRLRLKKFCDKKEVSEAQAIRIALRKILHNVSEKCTNYRGCVK